MVNAQQRVERDNARQRYNQTWEMLNEQIEQARADIPDATANALSIHVELIKGLQTRYNQLEDIYNDSLTNYAEDEGVEQNDHVQVAMGRTRAILTIQAELTTRITELKEAQGNNHIANQQNLQRQQQAIRAINDFKMPEDRKFDGLPEHYQGSWQLFQAQVHSIVGVTGAVKMAKLVECVKGDAAQLLQGLTISDENYNEAIQLLQTRFGDVRKIKDAHQTALQMMAVPQDPDYPSLCKHIDSIEKHLRNLQTANENIEQSLYITLVKQRLPIKMLGKLEEHNEGDWTMATLRRRMQWYLQVEHSKWAASQSQKAHTQVTTNPVLQPKQSSSAGEEKMSTLVGTEQRFKPQQRRRFEAVQQRQSTSAGPTMKPKRCRYCSRTSHYADECRQYGTLEERRARIRELELCFNCLGEKHDVQICKFQKKCTKCTSPRKHHMSICSQSTTTQNQGSGRTNNRRPYQQGSSRTNNMVNNDGEESDDELIPAVIATPDRNKNSVIMKTMLVDMRNRRSKKFMKVRAMGDCGSGRTYITNKLRLLLGLKVTGPEYKIKVGVFGTKIVKDTIVTPTEAVVKFSSGELGRIELRAVDVVTSSLIRPAYKVTIPDGIQLADSIPTVTEEVEIDFLIGNDIYDNIVGNETIYLKEGMMLKSSKFGWIPTGRIRTGGTNSATERESARSSIPHLLSMVGLELDSKAEGVDQLWNMETIGIKDSVEKTTEDNGDQIAERKFKETLKYEEGRYHTTFPWKDHMKAELPDNKDLAKRRFTFWHNKEYRHDSNVTMMCDKIIEEQLSLGIIEEVNENDEPTHPMHYLSHHPVITPEKETTKVRIVYNGAAKVKKTLPSINETMHRGSVMLEDLLGLLIKFRMYAVVMLADIAKAFLQVGLQMPDRDVTRFFWYENPTKPDPKKLRCFRFKRVPFGLIASPFLLAAVIKHHLTKFNTPVAKQILKGLYVDNVMIGLDRTDLQAQLKIRQEAKDMFSKAGMNLREWISSDPRFVKQIPESDRIMGKIVKVLGYMWDPIEDVILPPSTEKIMNEEQHTKREVARSVAKLFDPTGLWCPALAPLKMFLQTLWEPGMKWDSELTAGQLKEWNETKKKLKDLEKVKVKRYVGTQSNSNDMIVFCDASAKAYCAAVYLRQDSDKLCNVSLVMAKMRLAPKDGATIPRLELMALLIAKRILIYAEKQVGLKIDKRIIYSDSQCVLGWLSSGKTIGQFVDNRIKEIRELEGVSFRYVNTTENPADFPTRGLTATKLLDNKMWFQGPNWLKKPIGQWPEFQFPEITPIYLKEMNACKDQAVCISTEAQPKKSIVDLERFSNLTRLQRTVGYVFRFSARPNARSKGELTVKEMKKSMDFLIKESQQRSFGNLEETAKKVKLALTIDEDGIIRCSGRLQPDGEITQAMANPVLLSTTDKLTQLVIQQIHEDNFHIGESQTLAMVRRKFWVPKGRAQVAKVIRNCKRCKRYVAKAFKLPEMAPLPFFRTVKQIPFRNVGIDVYGHLNVKDGTTVTKKYVLLFTCLTTRAVHSEILDDLTTIEVMIAFRCFTAIRGMPELVVSDNAKQFHLMDSTLQTLWDKARKDPDLKNSMANRGISWKFITELSPWQGGVYERMIRVVKTALRKALGSKLTTRRQLEVLLREVDSVVNKRPLTYVTSDANSTKVITPGDFLSLFSDGFTIDALDSIDEDYTQETTSAEDLAQLWKRGLQCLDKFWQIWKEEYLLSLRERYDKEIRQTGTQEHRLPKIGEIVLVEEKNQPRNKWALAKIMELHKSEDGKTRSATVERKKKMINRSISQLYSLELVSELVDAKQVVRSTKRTSEPERRSKREAAKKGELKTQRMISEGKV